MSFTQEAHNAVFIGGTGTGKTHWQRPGRGRHYAAKQAGAVLLNGRSGEPTGARRLQAKPGKLAFALMRMDR